MRIYLIIIYLLLISFVCMGQATTDGSDRTTLSSFCHIPLPDHLKQANITFTDVYAFKLSKIGIPVDIKKFRAKYTKIEDVENCVQKWQFNGFAEGSIFHVEFSWKHGLGWIKMRISSKNFSQITVLRKDSAR